MSAYFIRSSLIESFNKSASCFNSTAISLYIQIILTTATPYLTLILTLKRPYALVIISFV